MVSVLVKMPEEIKNALIEQCVLEQASINDVAVGVLSDRLDFDFEPSGRRPSFRSHPEVANVVLRMPQEGKDVIQNEALAARLNMTDYVNAHFAEHFGIEWEPHGRRRVPFGGGARGPRGKSAVAA